MKKNFIVFFLLFNFSLHAQNVYKGGKGDGYAMETFSNYVSSINSLDFKKLIIYPNPIKKRTQRYIHIKVSLAIKSIEISDFKGIHYQTICSKNNKIDCSFLPRGIYYLKIFTEKLIFTKKIIIL